MVVDRIPRRAPHKQNVYLCCDFDLRKIEHESDRYIANDISSVSRRCTAIATVYWRLSSSHHDQIMRATSFGRNNSPSSFPRCTVPQVTMCLILVHNIASSP